MTAEARSADPIAHWHALVRDENGSGLCDALAARMRERRLTFGGRLLCPFLRPFFLDPRDEQRVNMPRKRCGGWVSAWRRPRAPAPS